MIRTPLNHLTLRRLELRKALVALADSLNAIEESGPPTPALFAVTKQIRQARTALLHTLTAFEREGAR